VADRQACPICRQRLGEVVCDPCRAHLARQLAAIPALLAATRADTAARADATDSPGWDPISRDLPAGPVPAGPRGPISRHSGLAHSPAPVISGTVERVVPLPASIVRLALWVPGPAEPIAWLTRHLDRICDGSRDLRDFASDLNHAIADLRRRTGDRRIRIGLCPIEDCGTELLAEPRAKKVTCDGCGKVWHRRHWLWLTDTLRAA
jgi:hypothetical protein